MIFSQACIIPSVMGGGGVLHPGGGSASREEGLHSGGTASREAAFGGWSTADFLIQPDTTESAGGTHPT